MRYSRKWNVFVDSEMSKNDFLDSIFPHNSECLAAIFAMIDWCIWYKYYKTFRSVILTLQGN